MAYSCLCIELSSLTLKKRHFNILLLFVSWLEYNLLFFCHFLIDCSVLLRRKQTKSQTEWQFPPAWEQRVAWLLPPQISGLWTCALPRSVRLMWTGHLLHCLVALITSRRPTGWFLLWAVTVPERWLMALMSASGPSESSLILAEVNREICDRKIQSIWQWKTFLFLYTERATWRFAMKTRLCGFDINPWGNTPGERPRSRLHTQHWVAKTGLHKFL